MEGLETGRLADEAGAQNETPASDEFVSAEDRSAVGDQIACRRTGVRDEGSVRQL